MATPNLVLSRRPRKRPDDAQAWRELCHRMNAARHRVLLEQLLRRGPCRCPAEGFPWPA